MALKSPQKSLKSWGKQKWRTSDGSPSKGKKRYLPDKAWNALTAGEKRATNAAKSKGNKKGKQFVKQPKKIADKVKSYRAVSEGGVMKKPMNPGMKALKKAAPAVAKKMGYMGGGMAKKPKGYAHGGMANCGASMKPNRKSKS